MFLSWEFVKNAADGLGGTVTVAVSLKRPTADVTGRQASHWPAQSSSIMRR